MGSCLVCAGILIREEFTSVWPIVVDRKPADVSPHSTEIDLGSKVVSFLESRSPSYIYCRESLKFVSK